MADSTPADRPGPSRPRIKMRSLMGWIAVLALVMTVVIQSIRLRQAAAREALLSVQLAAQRDWIAKALSRSNPPAARQPSPAE